MNAKFRKENEFSKMAFAAPGLRQNNERVLVSKFNPARFREHPNRDRESVDTL
jgi:hypothetical protein